MFKKRTDEEKAARAQRKADKKAEIERRVTEGRERRKADKERRQADEIDALKSLLQDGETLDGTFRTNEVLMKKHVLVTSQRLIVSLTARDTESIFLSHVAGLEASDFLGVKELKVTVVGRKDKIELKFETGEERDQLRDLISARLVSN